MSRTVSCVYFTHMKQLVYLCILFASLLFGCGGGGANNQTPTPASKLPKIKTLSYDAYIYKFTYQGDRLSQIDEIYKGNTESLMIEYNSSGSILTYYTLIKGVRDYNFVVESDQQGRVYIAQRANGSKLINTYSGNQLVKQGYGGSYFYQFEYENGNLVKDSYINSPSAPPDFTVHTYYQNTKNPFRILGEGSRFLFPNITQFDFSAKLVLSTNNLYQTKDMDGVVLSQMEYDYNADGYPTKMRLYYQEYACGSCGYGPRSGKFRLSTTLSIEYY